MMGGGDNRGEGDKLQEVRSSESVSKHRGGRTFSILSSYQDSRPKLSLASMTPVKLQSLEQP